MRGLLEQYQKQIEELRKENEELRRKNEQLRQLALRFTDGMMAFEIRSGAVRPLYISDNICHFFGYSREEWLDFTRTLHPIDQFVSKSGIPLDVFLRLLQEGEAVFDFLDMKNGNLRRMRAVCTESSDPTEPRYVLLYEVKALQEKKEQSVQIRTFGYFDVFVEGRPIAFRNEKSKELLALLVDRRGGFVTSAEAISYLWEDEAVSQVTLARYRKVALRLKNLLEEYGIAQIVETVDGKRRIVPEAVSCDLFRYLQGDSALFKGSYLLNYSWGENTLAELMKDK
ncbi:MAG: hypothetical protein IJ411_04095 [Oscillospiraceae bacterium]|nr:hypothetical protein [Oscillospiraceae bacterium]